MPQTRKRRRRKHRGTQAGTIEARGRTGRPRTKGEAKDIARKRRQERLDRPPSWRSAINRGAIAAALFGVLVVVAFGRPVAAGAMLAAIMVLLYIPLGYGTDTLIYRWRQKRKAQTAQGGKGARK